MPLVSDPRRRLLRYAAAIVAVLAFTTFALFAVDALERLPAVRVVSLLLLSLAVVWYTRAARQGGLPSSLVALGDAEALGGPPRPPVHIGVPAAAPAAEAQ